MIGSVLAGVYAVGGASGAFNAVVGLAADRDADGELVQNPEIR